MPWRRERLPTPVFWPGEFHGLFNVHKACGAISKKLLPSRNVLGVVIKKGFKRGDGQEACFTQIHSKNDTKNCINKYRKLQSKLHRDITTHCSEWPLVKTLDMISAGECVEKREPSNPVAGNVN